ncbi:MAG TPA: FHA domain-containing serine/threonine-protein kinase [Ktedonobacteraceae bacterium]|nr:FHA domain-containing serine/threonine-protein kinase [Ktedonobacteraceae bacterium]
MSQRDPRLIGGVYRTSQVVISGGILTNYTAYNHNTNEIVGLIVLESPSPGDTQTVQQFFQSMEHRRSVKSPQVLQVYDWGLDGNRVYLATDPPRGVTLRYVLDNENIDLRRALDFAQQMTRGLIALHGQDIVGIDLRPQLITVDSTAATDRVQLDDVGLRSLLKSLGYVDSQRADDIGYLDPRYAPPEYIQGGLIGPWSDIYQLGLLLFELVTGRLPFVGRDSAETGILQCTSPAPRLVQYKHDAPVALQGLVDRALEKNPDERFIHAGALLNALESLQAPVRQPGEMREGSGVLHQTTDQIPELEGDIAEQPTKVPTGRSEEKAAKNAIGSTKEKPLYANLCYEKDGVETQRFAITEPKVIVGRTDPRRGHHPDIDLTALDPKMTVSRQHARISYKEALFYIEDLKSHNKTRLGELPLAPLQPELLQHGDVVHFGAVRLVFRVPGMKDKPVLKEEK